MYTSTAAPCVHTIHSRLLLARSTHPRALRLVGRNRLVDAIKINPTGRLLPYSRVALRWAASSGVDAIKLTGRLLDLVL